MNNNISIDVDPNQLPSLKIDEQGNKFYYRFKELHRENGPAIEYVDGFKAWVLNGKLHRVDGPAITYSSGTRFWFLNDKEYSCEEWFKQLTPQQQNNYLWNLDE